MIIRPLTIMIEKPEPPGISLLPFTNWTIPSKSVNTVTLSDSNTLNINGIGNWNELIYTRFQPEESGTYNFSIKWSAPNGLDFWSPNSSTSNLGVWFDTSLDPSRTYSYEGNRSQGILMYNYDNTSAISLEQTGTLNLNSSTNYYVWISLGTLEDYKLQIINFTEIKLEKV